EGQRGELAEMHGRHPTATLRKEAAKPLEAAAQETIGARAVAAGKFEAVADQGDQRLLLALGVKQRRPHFVERNRAELEMAKPARTVLDLTDRHFDDAIERHWRDLPAVERERARD